MYDNFTSFVAGPTDSTLVQLFRYTLVGGLAFAVDYGSLFALKEFAGIHYLWAAALAFTLGLATNYVLCVAWVFEKRAVRSREAEFAVFTLLGIVGLGINEVVMFTLTSIAGLHYLWSKLVATGVTYGWNFLSRKTILFSTVLENEVATSVPPRSDA